MESLNCTLCKNPTFICTCDSNWKDFGNLIGRGTTDPGSGVVYTDINISTMTVCFNFNQFVNLKILNENLPDTLKISYNPGSKKSKVPKKKGTDSFYNSFDIKISICDHSLDIFSNVSIFIFPNGKVKAAGAKTIGTIYSLIDELINIINYVPGTVEIPDTLAAENIKIQMICSDFKIKPIKDDPDGWCIKQEDLKNILVNEHSLSATFSSLSRYPGINLKYPSTDDASKNVSLLIFRSGSIIITGAKNAKDILNSYNFITQVICKNASKLFYYDINEEIKQKKKKNKIISNING
jgi:TATA-box binding protein (TBP) (component of TFIID and TFIIIB)